MFVNFIIAENLSEPHLIRCQQIFDALLNYFRFEKSSNFAAAIGINRCSSWWQNHGGFPASVEIELHSTCAKEPLFERPNALLAIAKLP